LVATGCSPGCTNFQAKNRTGPDFKSLGVAIVVVILVGGGGSGGDSCSWCSSTRGVVDVEGSDVVAGVMRM